MEDAQHQEPKHTEQEHQGGNKLRQDVEGLLEIPAITQTERVKTGMPLDFCANN